LSYRSGREAKTNVFYLEKKKNARLLWKQDPNKIPLNQKTHINRSFFKRMIDT